MLEDLVKTIGELKNRIKENRDSIENYESRTRATLIDPMLGTLGWDVSDPGIVEIEPRVKDGWADYALLDGNRKTVIFVEAKKLADKNLHITQTVGYAVSHNIENNTNVRYCVSTNGDSWEVYDITAQKSVMSVSLTGENVAKCALKFLGLWRLSLSDGSFDSPIEPLGDQSTPSTGDNGTNISTPELAPGCKVLVKQSAHAMTFRGRVGTVIQFDQRGGVQVQVGNVKKWMSRNSLEIQKS